MEICVRWPNVSSGSVTLPILLCIEQGFCNDKLENNIEKAQNFVFKLACTNLHTESIYCQNRYEQTGKNPWLLSQSSHIAISPSVGLALETSEKGLMYLAIPIFLYVVRRVTSRKIRGKKAVRKPRWVKRSQPLPPSLCLLFCFILK